MTRRLVSLLLLLPLAWTQLGSGYLVICEFAEPQKVEVVSDAVMAHGHSLALGDEGSSMPDGEVPQPDCSFLIHSQSCSAAIGVPTSVVIQFEASPSSRALATPSEAPDLLLARSLLRPPRV